MAGNWSGLQNIPCDDEPTGPGQFAVHHDKPSPPSQISGSFECPAIPTGDELRILNRLEDLKTADYPYSEGMIDIEQEVEKAIARIEAK